MNLNRDKISVTFWIIFIAALAVIGVPHLIAWANWRARSESHNPVKWTFGEQVENKPVHPPIVWTTNGSIITAEGWDDANKCMARWTRSDSPGAQTLFSWSRLGADAEKFWMAWKVEDQEDSLRRENAALKKRVEELEAQKRELAWNFATAAPSEAWKYISPDATNRAITQDDLRNITEGNYPSRKQKPGDSVMTLPGQMTTGFIRMIVDGETDDNPLVDNEQFAIIAPASFFTP